MNRRTWIAIAAPTILSAPRLAPAAENGFTGSEYIRQVEGKTRTAKGTLSFANSKKAIQFASKESTLDIPYSNVTKLVYERAAKPRYAAGLLLAWPLLFTKSKKHFLTVMYKDAAGATQHALFRLDKSNYQHALAEAESQTGVAIERIEER